MISLIEARGFRCLRYIRRPLDRFQVLVGPNASGKTTFLDVVGFLHDLVSDGLDAAVTRRTANFEDLVWRHESDSFELAIEAAIPTAQRELLEDTTFDTVRYEVGVRLESPGARVGISAETGWLKVSTRATPEQRDLFPQSTLPPKTIFSKRTAPGKLRLFNKVVGGNDNYYSEANPRQTRWSPAFKLGPYKSTLANLPEDEHNFPVSTWLKQLICDGIEEITLNSLAMRQASRPGQGSGLKPDGSNLPWVVADLERRVPEKLTQWVAHLRTALPDLRGISTKELADTKERYLCLRYDGGLEVPSWMASDGTLRLLALTLPAYLDRLKNVYLIEEPENGIHPVAVDAMYQSLSSVYDAQVLLATHSPVILGTAEPDHVLCFAKDEEHGATDIVRGSEHPGLRDWQGEVDLGTLFASGVLG